MKVDSEFKPERVLCVAAHPDDLEFSAAGSVAKWTEAGAEVFYLICTDGCKGSDDRRMTGAQLTAMRRAEQRDAARILGVKEVTFLDYEDGACECCLDLKRDIAREIRRRKPDSVVCFDPTMVYSASRGIINHPDHRAVGQATVDAFYPLARDHLSFPSLLKEGFEPHKAITLLLANFDKADFMVDICDTFDLKIKSLAAHVSQFPDMVATEAEVRDWARDIGRLAGCDLAEGFVRVTLT